MADSSLSQDVLGSSFFDSSKRVNTDIATIDSAEPTEGPQKSSISKNTNDSIELDPINSNPCMITFIKVIEEIYKKFGSTYTAASAPKWMLELYSKCSSPDTHPNIKIFIIKLILNVKQEIFEPYAE